MNNVDGTKQYEKFVDKARMMHQQKKRRPLTIAKGASDLLGNFLEVAEALQMKTATRSNIILLSAAMGNLKKSESALGLFSDAFDDTAAMLAKQIIKLVKKNAPESSYKIVKWWLETMAIALVGFLNVAREDQKGKEGVPPIDPLFRDELILSLFFHSGYPKRIFKEMAEALELEGQPERSFISIFEMIGLIFVFFAYSNEDSIRDPLVNILKKELAHHLNTIKLCLQNKEEAEKLIAYLDLADLALEKGEIEAFTLTLYDLLDMANYPKEDFKSDIADMKELFKRLKIAYFASQEDKTNMMHMIG